MKIWNLRKAPGLAVLRAQLTIHGVGYGSGLRGNRISLKSVGTISVGRRVTLQSYPNGEAARTGLRTDRPEASIRIGDNCLVNGTMIFSMSSVTIGDNCMFGPGAKVVDNDSHRPSADSVTRRLAPASAPIVINDNVWIGMNALILKGVEIGRNSIVAAGAVVTKDVPENVLVAGNPARVVKGLE